MIQTSGVYIINCIYFLTMEKNPQTASSLNVKIEIKIDPRWPQFPGDTHGTIRPHTRNCGQWLSPPLRLAGTTQCRGGWSYPSNTDLVLIVAESQCTGLYRAGYHPGCCLWGVGSGCTDTTKHRLTRGQKKAEKKDRKKDREEGGRLHLKWNIIRVRRKEGGWREKEKDNGERSRMAQVDSPLCCCGFFSMPLHIFFHLWLIFFQSFAYIWYFFPIYLCCFGHYSILHLAVLWWLLLTVGESVGHGE